MCSKLTMTYTLEEKYNLIKKEVLNCSFKNPIQIADFVMHKNYINIHGPEHHFLDGASFLVAYKNIKGPIDIFQALDELAKRTIKMPGAMCGYWGVCGSVAAIGAALSIVHNTSPLSDDDFYKDHMEYTSFVINEMSKIGGPRCCKRNAFISLNYAIKFIKEKYGFEMEVQNTQCNFKNFNRQCLKEKCPFYK